MLFVTGADFSYNLASLGLREITRERRIVSAMSGDEVLCDFITSSSEREQ